MCKVSLIIWSICSWLMTGLRPRPSCTSPTQPTPSDSKCSAPLQEPSNVTPRAHRRCSIRHTVAGHQQALGLAHGTVGQRDAARYVFE